MHKVSYLVKLIDVINEWAGRIVAFLIIFMALVMGYEVILRYGFDDPTFWAHETTQLVFGAYFILGGAYTLLHNGHVNMDVVYRRFPPRIRAVVDIVTSVLFYFFCVLLLWKGGQIAWESIAILERTHSPWAPPFWPVKLTIPIGAFLLLLQGLAKSIHDLYTIKGKELK